jgi:hypothetical protein
MKVGTVREFRTEASVRKGITGLGNYKLPDVKTIEVETWLYGSVYPLCLAILKKTLTEGRIRDLKALVTSGEGDVCNGYRAPDRKSD